MFLGPTEIILHKQTVALVDQGFGVVAVVANSDVDVFLRLGVVVLEEVEERDVGGHPRHCGLVFLLESFEGLDGFLDLFLLEIGHGLEDLDLGLDLGVGGGFEFF